jgi:hypothetical protein
VTSTRPVLQHQRPDHAPALLAFERDNRAYFAASIPDRGDAYFADFDARHRALLKEQDSGLCHFHVLVEAGGAIVGRVNLVDAVDGSASLDTGSPSGRRVRAWRPEVYGRPVRWRDPSTAWSS